MNRSTPQSPLTKRQGEVLRCIGGHQLRTGMAPTLREIGREIRVRSTNGVNDHLKALEKKGQIILKAEGRSRAIQLTPEGWTTLGIVQVTLDLDDAAAQVSALAGAGVDLAALADALAATTDNTTEEAA